MNIGTLITRPLQDHAGDFDKAGAVGLFTLPVAVHEKLFEGAGDKKAYIRHVIAMHLASAIKDTEVPKEYWALEVDKKIQREFNWPEIMPFGGN